VSFFLPLSWGEARLLLTCLSSLRLYPLSECLHVLEGHTSTIRCIKVLQGRPIAVSGSRDASIRVWDLESGRLLHLLAGHDQSVRCIEVSGNKVVSGSYDCTCRVSRNLPLLELSDRDQRLIILIVSSSGMSIRASACMFSEAITTKSTPSLSTETDWRQEVSIRPFASGLPEQGELSVLFGSFSFLLDR
jgi:WD40 repeat protein